MVINDETNLLRLITPWLDNSCQIKPKHATVTFSRTKHTPNELFWSWRVCWILEVYILVFWGLYEELKFDMPFCIYNIKSAKWAMLDVWYIFIHIPHRIYYFSYHWHTYSIFICCSYRAYKLHFVWAGTPYSNNCCYWRSCFGWWPRVGSFMRSPHMWCCLYLEHYQIPTFLWDNYFLVFEYLNAYLHSYVQGKMQNLECQKQALPLYLGT